jgi:glutaredoxin
MVLEKYDNDIVLLVMEDCMGCKSIKNLLKEEIERGFIKVLDVYKDPDAKNIIEEVKEKLEISYVPTLLKIRRTSSGYEVCNITEEKCETVKV